MKNINTSTKIRSAEFYINTIKNMKSTKLNKFHFRSLKSRHFQTKYLKSYKMNFKLFNFKNEVFGIFFALEFTQ